MVNHYFWLTLAQWLLIKQKKLKEFLKNPPLSEKPFIIGTALKAIIKEQVIILGSYQCHHDVCRGTG